MAITKQQAVNYIYSLGQLVSHAYISANVANLDIEDVVSDVEGIVDVLKDVLINEDDDVDSVEDDVATSHRKAPLDIQIKLKSRERLQSDIQSAIDTDNYVYNSDMLALEDQGVKIVNSSSGSPGDAAKLSFILGEDDELTASVSLDYNGKIHELSPIEYIERKGKSVILGEKINDHVFYHVFEVARFGRNWLDDLTVNVKYTVER